MIITWYGQSCFKIQDTQKSILIDPYSPKRVGLRGPNLIAEIIILTNKDDKKQVSKDLKEDTFLISAPGEYETKNVFIYGTGLVDEKKQQTIYQVEVDGLRVGVLGEINRLLNDKELEKLDGIDILFVPVGGKDVLGAKKAVELINLIEPNLVIPCCYQFAAGQGKTKTETDSKEKFLAEMGIKNPEVMQKLSIQKKEILSEETKVIILEPKI
jgi:L-ascorbate metabolism protein UlaG (beta-lactamase superfamily)